jgi:DNA polymerase I-like protein with 3'-5' exonuclease and polymerase domains
VSYITNIEVENQISDDVAAQQMQRLVDNKVKIIMFNAKFDIRVIKNQLGVKLTAHWDGYIAARLLNENELENNLKALHKKYCLNGVGDAFTFEDLFKGIPFTHIPIKTGYLYAARDPEITYELYEFQRPYLTEGDAVCIECELTGPAFIFNHIEMPVIDVVAEMEDNGICFDSEFAKKLSVKYNATLKECEKKFNNLCNEHAEEIAAYKLRTPGHKLDEPISISSPVQLSILFYDILKVPVQDKKTPRGTGEEILEKINTPLAKSILEYREVAKLISTYIDKMDGVVNPKTGRIHCSFNQIGADTGRFSSSDPNMQNIPSHNKEIRRMFTAAPGNVLLSSDYSAQEPRITAHLSKDAKMIKAYKEGKDLYAEMASLAFNKPYDECKEFRADGTKNPEGKERRGHAKAIFLGICYGKGVKAIGENLGVSTQKAQQIYDSVLKEFPGLKQLMIDSENMARELGYVTTILGRKRRLPDMQLEPYEFSYGDTYTSPAYVNVFFDDNEEVEEGPLEVPEATKQKYINLLNSCRGYREKEAVKARAKAEGIAIKDNGDL